MKNFILRTCLSFLVILQFSCSKEDENQNNPDQGKISLSFSAVLNDLASSRQADKQQIGNIPVCSDDSPAFVEVVVTHLDVPVAGTMEQPLRLAVFQDNQGIYLTEEKPELELIPGTYTLEYFKVLNDDLEVIWIAPRAEDGEINFGNFVAAPLPLEIDLRPGTKKYVSVDVLCFDDRMVNLYGYLFFELQTNQAIPFCVFGNFCDETGRHIDAVSFSVNVWNFSGDDAAPKGTILHENLYNVIWVADDFENGIAEYGYSPVCMALPDKPGLDQYYFEIYVSSIPNPIRSGVITDDDVRSLFDGDNNVEYYHFREGNCNLGDSPELFEDLISF